MVAAAGFIGAAAQVSIPLPGTPVPVTGQTFAVLLTGAALGARRSAVSLLIYLLAGAFFVEFIFDWEGIGKVTVEALEKLDYPVVMGSVLISSVFFILISILADILYGIVDPRVRIQ